MEYKNKFLYSSFKKNEDINSVSRVDFTLFYLDNFWTYKLFEKRRETINEKIVSAPFQECLNSRTDNINLW